MCVSFFLFTILPQQQQHTRLPCRLRHRPSLRLDDDSQRGGSAFDNGRKPQELGLPQILEMKVRASLFSTFPYPELDGMEDDGKGWRKPLTEKICRGVFSGLIKVGTKLYDSGGIVKGGHMLEI